MSYKVTLARSKIVVNQAIMLLELYANNRDLLAPGDGEPDDAARQLATTAWFVTEVTVTTDEKLLGIGIMDALEAAARLREGRRIEITTSGVARWAV